MNMTEQKNRAITEFRPVPIDWSGGQQERPVKVTAAGRVTRIGLEFHTILALEPAPTRPPCSEPPPDA